MSLKQSVNAFLREFKVKLDVWGILFLDRAKNSQALADLEIFPIEREKILRNLKLEDYCEGPLEEKQWGGKEMWVFGKEVKSKEVYIKITLGTESDKVLCISFHIAEHPMKYKLKKS